jgi:hypothetical protein
MFESGHTLIGAGTCYPVKYWSPKPYIQARLRAHSLTGSATMCSWPLEECTGTSGMCGIRKWVEVVGAAPESEYRPESCHQPLLWWNGNRQERFIGLFV